MAGIEDIARAEAWYQCLRGIATDDSRYSRINRRPGPPGRKPARHSGGIPAPHAGPVSDWLGRNPRHKEAVWAFAVCGEATKCRDYIRRVDAGARLSIGDIRRFIAFAATPMESRLTGAVAPASEIWRTPVGDMAASKLLAILSAMPGWEKHYRRILHGEVSAPTLFSGSRWARPTGLQAAMLALARRF